MAIATHHSIQISVLLMEPSAKASLQLHSINLIDIKAFINCKNLLKFWSLYITSFSTPPFYFSSKIYLVLWATILFWGIGHNQDFCDNNIYSAILSCNMNILNSSAPTRINRPPFSDMSFDVTISSNLF